MEHRDEVGADERLRPSGPSVSGDAIEAAVDACLAPYAPIIGPLYEALDSLAVQDLLLELQKQLRLDPYIAGGPALEDLVSRQALVRFLHNCRLAEAVTPARVGTPSADEVGIVPLRSGKRPAPLFVPATIDGLPVHGREIGNLLDEGWTLYSFVWRSAPHPGRYPASLEALAAVYVELLQQVYPAGPCFLAGVSFSATLAFEMAIQLQRAGRRIAFLGIIEDNADLHERHFGADSGEAAAVGSLRSASLVLNRRYVRVPYEGRIAFMRTPRSHHRARSDPDQGWADLARGGIDRYAVPGTHAALFTSQLAETFLHCLQTAAQRGPDWEPQAADVGRTLAASTSASARRLARRGELEGEIAGYRAVAREVAALPYWFHEIRGHAEAQAGNLEEAAACFAAAAAADAFPAANLVALASVLEGLGRIDDAIRATRRAFAWDEADPGIPTRLGNLLMRVGNVGEAREAFGAALAVRPGYPSAQEGLRRAEGELVAADERSSWNSTP